MKSIKDVEKFGDISIGDVVIIQGLECLFLNHYNNSYLFKTGKRIPNIIIKERDIEKYIKENVTLKSHVSMLDSIKTCDTEVYFSDDKHLIVSKVIEYEPNKNNMFHSKERLFFYPYNGKLYDFYPDNSYDIYQFWKNFPKTRDILLKYRNCLTQKENVYINTPKLYVI